MNNQVVTTGLIPLIIGSTELFQLQAFTGTLRNGVPWDLTGGSAKLILTDPTGAQTTFTATITGKGAQYNWSVVGPIGSWTRQWDVTDVNGIRQVSRGIPFNVQTS